MVKPKVLKINNASIVFYPVKEVRTIMVDVWVKAGSWYEKGPQWGLFHLLEHLLFSGTSKLPNHNSIELYKQTYGINNNAWTGGQTMGFWFKFPDISINEGLEFMDQIVFNSIIPEDQIEKEISIISQEYFDKWDDPVTRFDYFTFDNLIGRESHYYRDGIGQPEYLKTVGRKELVEIYHQYFQPQNIFISIVGNYNESFLIDKLTSILQKYQNRQMDEPKWAVLPPKDHFIKYQDNVSQSYILINWFLENEKKLDLKTRYGINMFSFILGGGANSILFKRIRQELGLVYNIRSRFWSLPKIYFFEIIVSVDTSKLDTLLENIKTVTEKFINNPISSTEFEQVRHYMDLQTLISFDSVDHISNNLVDDLFYEHHVYTPEDKIEIAHKIDLEQIKKLFSSKISWNNSYISVMNPKD
jgi:predicted Zn-dependent peptidase